MPRSIQDILAQAALPDDFTDEDVTELKQEVVREVTATLMFGTRLAPEGRFPTMLDRADKDLQALTAALLYSDGAAAHLAKFAEEPAYIDGALHFACLLSLADSSEGAQWWWQFAAGAGNATAAHCLHLFHLGRGELRDADHWAHQAVTMDTHVQLTPFSRRRTPRHRPTLALREAVGRLQVNEVEEWGFQVFRPDSHLAHQIEELADAP
ncbi:hypothetical protein [Streptomyces coeruleofuscus]|uniref:Uncharacterized protein n=1 Tax=Streptomyces coeruleofuscus TaxID=66879 RepID=A0ABN3JDH0_9ACTN